MKKTALIIIMLTVISKLFGLVRDVLLSYYYGTSSIADAYLIALTIPMVIFAVVGTAISTGFIPMYTNISKYSGEQEANTYTSNLVNIVVIFSTLIIILSWIFTKEIVGIFAVGFEGETLLLAIKYTRIAFLSIYFTGLVYIFNGLLQIKNNYVVPALIGIPMNIVFIISIIIGNIYDDIFLSVGIVFAYLFQFLFLVPSVLRTGYKYRLVLNIKDENILKMITLAVPVVIGVSVNQINTLVDRTLASTIVIGGISALNYSNRINVLLQGVIVEAIATVIYPSISKMVANNDFSTLKKTIGSSLSAMSLIVLPATIGTMVFSEPIINLLYGRGAFDIYAVQLTSSALFYYSIGMVPFGIREILSRYFYALQDTKSPMINSAIGMILNIVLNLILSRYLGISGLALATSISGVIIALFMIITLRNKIGSFGIKLIIVSFSKILFASVVMGIFSKLSFNYFKIVTSQNISLLLAVFVGAVLYFVIIYFMKIEEVDKFFNQIRKNYKIGN